MEKNGLEKKIALLVIGGSAGSLEVIMQLLPALRPDLSFPVVIILHRKNSSDSTLVGLLATKATLPVKEADEKEKLQPGFIYIAPPDYHLLFEKDGTLSLDDSEKVHYSRPSIDVGFESAADCYKEGVAGLLLSGANADGTEGLKQIKSCGGITIVQNPATAEVPYMPNSAIAAIEIDYILAVSGMIEKINSF